MVSRLGQDLLEIQPSLTTGLTEKIDGYYIYYNLKCDLVFLAHVFRLSHKLSHNSVMTIDLEMWRNFNREEKFDMLMDKMSI